MKKLHHIHHSHLFHILTQKKEPCEIIAFNKFENFKNNSYQLPTDMNRITTHPGNVLKEELEARGISQKKFSEVLSIPYTLLNEILKGKRPVTTEFVLMMEAALGINLELLINMQTRYNMSLESKNERFEALMRKHRGFCCEAS